MRLQSYPLQRIWAVLLVLALFSGACQWAAALTNTNPRKTVAPNTPQVEPEGVPTGAVPSETAAGPVPSPLPPLSSDAAKLSFAQFNEPAVQAEPSIRHDMVAPDLSNVYNPFVLSSEQVERLAKDGIVVTPGNQKEFFMLYEAARYDNLPVFVTSDSLLHSYHLLFDKFLRTAEREHLIPLLRDLNAALLKTAGEQYQELSGGPWEEEARRVVAFVGVASRTETRSALLLANALRKANVQRKPALETWADLYSPTVFFVGRSDDLAVVQYIQVMDQIFGPQPSLEAITDDAKLDDFIEAANLLPTPRILGIVMGQDQDEEKTTKGMRFMGQRFVPDAYIFRQLMYRNVGTADNRRGLPKGLDLLAAMGSERAYSILDEMSETKYLNYTDQMAKVSQWLSGLSV